MRDPTSYSNPLSTRMHWDRHQARQHAQDALRTVAAALVEAVHVQVVAGDVIRAASTTFEHEAEVFEMP